MLKIELIFFQAGVSVKDPSAHGGHHQGLSGRREAAENGERNHGEWMMRHLSVTQASLERNMHV